MYKKILIGIIAGFISGLFGAGGGMIVVPAFIHLLKVEEKTARATAIFAILPMVITSGIFYINSKYVDWGLSIKCAIRWNCWWLYWSKITKEII